VLDLTHFLWRESIVPQKAVQVPVVAKAVCHQPGHATALLTCGSRDITHAFIMGFLENGRFQDERPIGDP